MAITIKEVTTKADLKKFVKFNIELYKGSPYHVPGLIMDDVNTLDKDKNPAFDFCEAKYFLAYKDGKIVGRIAGIINHKANEIWEQQNARFSFVDFIDDKEVSTKLFEAVENWTKEKGLKALHGPLSFTDLDQEGLLIEGFDKIGTMATAYSYPYYREHIEALGYEKDHDWHEFLIEIPKEIPEKHKRISEIVMKKYGLRIMKFKNTKEIWPYARRIFELVNEAFQPLFGYTPLTDKQIEYYIKMYIPMLNLNLVTLVIREEDDAVIGLGLTLPSLAKALQKSGGRLFPFGWYHLLKAMYGKNEVADLLIVAVHPDYQNKGVNALMFYDLIPIFNRLGFKRAESNPELEINNKVQAQWEYFDTKHIKTRRAFIKHLS